MVGTVWFAFGGRSMCRLVVLMVVMGVQGAVYTSWQIEALLL